LLKQALPVLLTFVVVPCVTWVAMAGRADAQYMFDDMRTHMPTGTLHFADDGASSAINGINRPPAVCFKNKTYVTYQGVNNAPMISVYDHATKQWGPLLKAGTSPLGDTDTHGAPSMLIDKEGYIHLFFGSHGGKQMYVKSRKPEDITDWVEMPPVAGNITYPNAVGLETGETVMIGRFGGHVSPWGELSSTDGGKTWSAPRAVVDYRPHGIYGATTVGSDNKTLHFGWCFQNKRISDKHAFMDVIRKRQNWWTGVWDERHHAFYAMRDEKGVWRNVQGEELKTPINLEQSFEKCLVYRGDWPEHGQHPIVEVDLNNLPCLTFINGRLPGDRKPWTADTVTYDQNFARFDGKQWNVSSITQTDSMWDIGQAVFFGPAKGQIDVYLVAEGSRINGKNTTFGRWGGDIQLWRSMDDGKTWKKQAAVPPFLRSGRLFNYPTRVVNYHLDGKIVFVNFTTDRGYRSNDFRHNVYLYGDSGFCRARP